MGVIDGDEPAMNGKYACCRELDDLSAGAIRSATAQPGNGGASPTDGDLVCHPELNIPRPRISAAALLVSGGQLASASHTAYSTISPNLTLPSAGVHPPDRQHRRWPGAADYASRAGRLRRSCAIHPRQGQAGSQGVGAGGERCVLQCDCLVYCAIVQGQQKAAAAVCSLHLPCFAYPGLLYSSESAPAHKCRSTEHSWPALSPDVSSVSRAR